MSNRILELNKSTVEDSTAMRVITLMTLVYLPSSFVGVSSTLCLDQCSTLTSAMEPGILRYGLFRCERQLRCPLGHVALYLGILCDIRSADDLDARVLEVEPGAGSSVTSSPGSIQVDSVGGIAGIGPARRWFGCDCFMVLRSSCQYRPRAGPRTRRPQGHICGSGKRRQGHAAAPRFSL